MVTQGLVVMHLRISGELYDFWRDRKPAIWEKEKGNQQITGGMEWA